MDSLLKHEIHRRFNLWYRWQLSLSEKKTFLRRFDSFLLAYYRKSNTRGIKAYILTIQTNKTNGFIGRISAVSKLLRLFEYVEETNRSKQLTTNYYDNANVIKRGEEFITRFDTIMRDTLLNEYSNKLKRSLLDNPDNEYSNSVLPQETGYGELKSEAF